MLLCLSKLKELIPTPLLDTLTTMSQQDYRTAPSYTRTIKTEATSTCSTQETPKDRQKLGQEYFL